MVEIDPFHQVLEAYISAVFAKDVGAFTALYDSRVHVFDMWGAWSIEGISAWRGMAENWFSSLGNECVSVTSDDEASCVVGDLVVGHAILTYTATAMDGSTLRSLSNRATMALRKTDDAWKIFHEHTSAPIDHQSHQAILKRSES